MAFVVVYDACVLYSAPLRDLLIRVARSGIVRARWSNDIVDECFRNILKNRPNLALESLERTRILMNEAVPDCLISGYQSLIPAIELPDPNDRHVLAAAIRAGAQVIVTFNLKDFPKTILSKYDIEAKHPDDFVLDSIELAPGAMVNLIIEQAHGLRNPTHTPADLLRTLRTHGLVQSTLRLKDFFSIDDFETKNESEP